VYSGPSRSFSDTAPSGSSLLYRVKAVDNNGTGASSDYRTSGSVSLSVNQPPTMPGTVSVSSTSVYVGGSITVSWTASTDPEMTTITYKLERRVDSGSWEQLYSGTSRSFTNTAPSSPGTVTYRVKAVDGAGIESGYQNSSAVTVNAIVYPSTPGSITATPNPVQENQPITISWGASTNASRYYLERRVNNGSWTNLTNTTSRTHADTALANWDSVAYRVYAYHTSGGTSGYATSANVTVTHNQPPVITGADGDLGEFTDSFDITLPTYQVSDPNPSDTVTVEERFDGALLRPAFIADQDTDITPTIAPEQYCRIPNGQHTLTIQATDSKSASIVRTYTFMKNVTVIEVRTTDCLPADTKPDALRKHLQGMFPEGIMRMVKMCNNGYDDDPTWEDRTAQYLAGQNLLFQNTVKTAADWGIRIWVRLDRNSAVGPMYLTGIGGTYQ